MIGRSRYRVFLATTATLLASLAFVAPAAADDCDKATRNAVLAELAHTTFTLVPPRPVPTHVELIVDKDVIHLEQVWDADEGTVFLKGERHPLVKFKLEGIACRRLNGTIAGRFKEKAQGVLSEDHREIQYTFKPYGATDLETGEPAVTEVRLVRR